ncbi:hypothetical protein [Winogradskyella sp. A3E31]|uniref:hypothetical protein n=1 Tax=Winogradskyella sp. A3E31 TaxID=3349637 RepID=UPI00398B8A12
MEKDYLDNVFKNLKGEFDVHSPSDEHKARFIDKLNEASVSADETSERKTSIWMPLLVAAASILICLGVFATINSQPTEYDLASVSPELTETQNFFTLTIAEELKKLEAERSPLTEDIIYDAMREINELEKAYGKLKQDLKASGQDQRVIYAMISNFQTRIDILTNVLEHIENLKELKTTPNDTEITI